MTASASPDARLPIVVFASGRGSNFKALLDARDTIGIDVRALVCDRRTAPVLAIAEAANIPTVALRPRDFPDRGSFDRALFARAEEFKPDLIVLAGFMRVIDTAIVEAWRGRMINIHPSLLPKHPGLRTHERALANGDAMHGASVHFVTPELDGGPVISQCALPIVAGDTSETLAARLLPLEHRLLVATVEGFAQRRIVLAENGVEVDGKHRSVPMQLSSDGRCII
jgi:phosphoribosylglycinamide formyltransferase 1